VERQKNICLLSTIRDTEFGETYKQGREGEAIKKKPKPVITD
jgi:hypothetical protein